jgi:hypothetical protein
MEINEEDTAATIEISDPSHPRAHVRQLGPVPIAMRVGAPTARPRG